MGSGQESITGSTCISRALDETEFWRIVLVVREVSKRYLSIDHGLGTAQTDVVYPCLYQSLNQGEHLRGLLLSGQDRLN